VEPVAWDVRKPGLSLRWGLPPQEAWFNETTPFGGIATKELDHARGPLQTLETYLAEKARIRALKATL
jgi:catechol 2,3-dioxygenase